MNPNDKTLAPPTLQPAPSSPALPTYARTGNDNERAFRDTRTLLAHADVVRAIQGTLVRHGIARQDLGDGVADVQLAALQAVKGKWMPPDIAGWKALCCTIAERRMLKGHAREERRGRWHVGLCEDPDERGPLERSHATIEELIDMRRQLRVLQAMFEAGEMPDQGEAILEGVQDELSAREIGDELGLTTSAVEHRLSRMRALFKARLASLGMLILMLLIAVLLSGCDSRTQIDRGMREEIATWGINPGERGQRSPDTPDGRTFVHDGRSRQRHRRTTKQHLGTNEQLVGTSEQL